MKIEIKKLVDWHVVKKAMREVDPAMANAMVPECAYRGRCTELKPC